MRSVWQWNSQFPMIWSVITSMNWFDDHMSFYSSIGVGQSTFIDYCISNNAKGYSFIITGSKQICWECNVTKYCYDTLWCGGMIPIFALKILIATTLCLERLSFRLRIILITKSLVFWKIWYLFHEKMQLLQLDSSPRLLQHCLLPTALSTCATVDGGLGKNWLGLIAM